MRKNAGTIFERDQELFRLRRRLDAEAILIGRFSGERMMGKGSLLAAAAALAVLSAVPASGQTGSGATLCMPSIAPIPVTAQSQPHRRNQILPAGYIEEEFSVSCSIGGKPYKTIINVRRPADSAKASGIVLAEVWHWGNSWTIYPKVVDYLARRNHTTVIILGSPLALSEVKEADAGRYKAMSIPWSPKRERMSDVTVPQEFEILSQVGALIKSGGVPNVYARKLILAGMSGSGGQVRQYMHQEGNSAKFRGASVYDGYFPSQTALSMAVSPVPDVPVPTIEIQGETELMRSFQPSGFRAAYRRPDSPLYRLYEVPGMPHIATRGPAREFDRGWNCGNITLTDFPLNEIYAVSLDNLVNWVDKGTLPPTAPRIETNADGSVIARDSYGNAKGGVRTSYFEVPIATYNASSGNVPQTRGQGAPAARCDMLGNTKPLPAGELKKLYPSHADYVAKVSASLDRLEKERWILPEDAQALRDEAAKAKIP